MSYLNGRLQCDMERECTSPVAYLDEKGFSYCTEHGKDRKCSHRCRKLRPWELRWMREGKQLPSYEPRPMPREEAR